MLKPLLQKSLEMMIHLLLLSLNFSNATQIPVRLLENTTVTNWTTCEDFLEGTTFDASSILDKTWKVFYTWSIHNEESYEVRFREPTPTLIDRFRTAVGNSSIAPNWNDTAFYMESTMDLSALFIKTSTPGKFRVITSLEFDYNVAEEVIFALKVVDPGYLAFMNCKVQEVVALAPLDKFPKNDELEDAAQVLNIRHPYGFPYNVHDAMLKFDPALSDDIQEAFEEDQIEVEMSSGILDL